MCSGQERSAATPFYVQALATRRGCWEYEWALIGPDETIWHQSDDQYQLATRAAELNRAYELGRYAK